MSDLVYRVVALLCQVLRGVPIGTNLDVFHVLFALLSGRLLLFRGALAGALADLGLDKQAVRRAEAVLQRGCYETGDLLANWQQTLWLEQRFQAHVWEGYRPVACDLVGFYRPQLMGCSNKHYHSGSGKALPAVVLGLVAQVGSVGRMRFALPRLFLRAQPGDTDAQTTRRAIAAAAELLQTNEALVVDAGFPVALLLASGKHFVARVKKNFTARRNVLPEYKGRGRRPLFGESVRALGHHYGAKKIAADKPDATARWKQGRYYIRARIYNDLVLSTERPGACCFRLVVVEDPRYKEPLLLVTDLRVSAYAVAQLYRDRWPIEQLPLAAKQMLGAERAFVSGQKSRQRLPELALLAGNVLSYLAATSPAEPTGFWDRRPRQTCGRIRRLLFRKHFSDLPIPDGQLRKKNSVTTHLKTGVEGHRRSTDDRNPKYHLNAA